MSSKRRKRSSGASGDAAPPALSRKASGERAGVAEGGNKLLVAILVGIVIGVAWGVSAPTLRERANSALKNAEARLHAVQVEQKFELNDEKRPALDARERALKADVAHLAGWIEVDAKLANATEREARASAANDLEAAKSARSDAIAAKAELSKLAKNLRPVLDAHDRLVGWGGKLFGLAGELFLKLLKMLIVPLVMASMICGVAFLGDVRKIGRLGGGAIAYYMATTFIAVAIGITLVVVVQPGAGYPVDIAAAKEAAADKLASRGAYDIAQAFEDILRGFFTDNLFASMANVQILPLIVFSLVFGAILTTFEGGKRLIASIEAINDAILRFVRLIMYLAPIGIAGLVASKLQSAQETGEFGAALSALGKYAGVVIGGLFLHGFVVLPLLLFFFARRNPFAFIAALGKPLVTAFGTASSSATLPVTIETLEDNAGVSKRSAGFVAPLGATINMDGTALYEAVAAIFIAQAYGVHLGPAQLFVVFITATLAAIGAAGIPEAGLVTLILVLKAVDLPVEGIGLILVIDWFLDRCRTTINVWGDCVGAAIIDRWFPPGAGERAAA